MKFAYINNEYAQVMRPSMEEKQLSLLINDCQPELVEGGLRGEYSNCYN
jgi:hypothetical protein